MRPQYEYGAAVRVMRTIRNDGTYPGRATGSVLVRRGCVGFVRDVGTFLQDQLIYTVDFIEQQMRVGCREPELQPADAPWVATEFEFRDKVTPQRRLAVGGEIIAEPGGAGEVERVLIDEAAGTVSYHVRFGDRLLQVAEALLLPLGDAEPVDESEVVCDGNG